MQIVEELSKGEHPYDFQSFEKTGDQVLTKKQV